MHSVGWIHKFLRATPSSRRSVLWSLKVLNQRSLFLQTVHFRKASLVSFKFPRDSILNSVLDKLFQDSRLNSVLDKRQMIIALDGKD